MKQSLRLGIGGPVGSGKTALVEQLCLALRDTLNIAVVTNDIYTREDAEFLARRGVLPPERILGVGIVGYGAGELIAEGVLAVEMGATAKDLALAVHPHPTLSETIMEAAEAFYGHATHTMVRKKAG